jgi:glycosyltransferase involved in cell wall biosynthesis
LAAADNQRLRILFIAGSLAQGGAEKQLFYMLRTLKSMGAQSQVISLTGGEHFERQLSEMGITVTTIHGSPAARVLRIVRAARKFRPHFIQATHFFASFYAGAAGRITGIPSIGAIRGDLYHDINGVGAWGRLVLNLPTVFLANSNNARENALKLGIPARRMQVLRNVIDLREFDHRLAANPPQLLGPDHVRVITVARLIPVKRLERFLNAIAAARQTLPALQGLIVGDGKEKQALFDLASSLGLEPDQPNGSIQFLGERSDIPQLLSQSHIFMLTSDREGFPNVLLEAMAASLPIVATPAGETRDLVQNGANGYLVPVDDQQGLADCLAELALSPARRNTMGNEGRRIVERFYDFPRLENNLIDVYHGIAVQSKQTSAERIIDAVRPGSPRKSHLSD